MCVGRFFFESNQSKQEMTMTISIHLFTYLFISIFYRRHIPNYFFLYPISTFAFSPPIAPIPVGRYAAAQRNRCSRRRRRLYLACTPQGSQPTYQHTSTEILYSPTEARCPDLPTRLLTAD